MIVYGGVRMDTIGGVIESSIANVYKPGIGACTGEVSMGVIFES